MWTKKYAPKTLSEFAGNKKAIEDTIKWIRNWKGEHKKTLLVHGISGTGKTTALELIAKELRLQLISTNASDMRSAKALGEGFGHAFQQQSLFAAGKLIVFDEIDGLSSEDRGGASEILKLAKTSKFPIVLIANDISLQKLKAIKQASKLAEFEGICPEDIEKILRNICLEEKIECTDKIIKSVASTAGGDARAAINDLETLAAGCKKLPESAKFLSGRDAEMPIKETLKIIFKTMNAETANDASIKSDTDTEDLLQWVRENLPYEYTNPKDLAFGYDAISRASIFMGRIIHSQYWGYLSYAGQLLSAGVALSKKEKYPGIREPRYPGKIALMWRSKAERAQRDFIAAKLASLLHCGKKVALGYLPLLGALEKNNPEAYYEFIAELRGKDEEKEADG